MKISDFHGDAALDLLADLLEPISIIASDAEIQKMFKKKGTKLFAIAAKIIRSHKAEVMQILAATNGVPVEEYNPSATEIIGQLVDIMNDEDLAPFFNFAPTKTARKSSGSAMESTEEKEK